RHRWRRRRRPFRSLAPSEARVSRLRPARDGRPRGRELALGRERDRRLPVGRALRADSRKARHAGPRVVRGTGYSRRWTPGGALSLFFPAGAAVSARPLAGGHRTLHRLDGARSRAVPALRAAHGAVPRDGGIHHPDGAGREAFAARSTLDGRLVAPGALRFLIP